MELNLTGRDKHSTPDELQNLSAVMIHGDEIFVDQGAIHGKSRLERGIDFRAARSAEDVPNGEKVAVVWVTLKTYEKGRGFSGIASAELVIDFAHGIGYKAMGPLVNQMDRAVKGRVDVSNLTAEQKAKLAAFLQQLRADLWENTPEEVKAELA
ncbi:YwhD-like protein [Tumebacillus sp. BK434]|uniref:YwhD family protein n=1 Tax=Tumebacillus sp. BK434 TaxID=2512169 RepID=UPI0010540CC6|nr:YwhD family protein [Tumebacillus sp. BK434]TCP55419.1 YwhD-like protein [Tumebacillus sp. BK434]